MPSNNPDAPRTAADASPAHEATWRDDAIAPEGRRQGGVPADDSAVPGSIAGRFLRVDNRYYFPDRTLAFTDHGAKLKAQTHNTEVIRSLVAIAQARGWDAIRVSGSEAFCRQVWREASLRGIDVRGYRPDDVERAEVRRALESSLGRDPPRNAPGSPSGAPSQGDATAAPADEHDKAHSAGEHDAVPSRLQGRLIEAAAAPYRFDPKQSVSYYVKLRTDDGDRTLWGVDLERALVESKTQVRVGDVVAIKSRGSQRVTVKTPERDATGRVIRERQIATHRNTWLIEKPEWFEERALKAAAFRNESAARHELVQQHPDLAAAVVGLWLGEQFAATRIERPQDRERFVTLVKHKLAQAVERADPIHVPDLKSEVDRTAPRARGARGVVPPPDREPDVPPHVRG